MSDLARRRTAREVARYYYAHLNFTGYRPTGRAVGNAFGYSNAWGNKYMKLARELGFIRHDWDVMRIPRGGE